MPRIKKEEVLENVSKPLPKKVPDNKITVKRLHRKKPLETVKTPEKIKTTRLVSPLGETIAIGLRQNTEIEKTEETKQFSAPLAEEFSNKREIAESDETNISVLKILREEKEKMEKDLEENLNEVLESDLDLDLSLSQDSDILIDLDEEETAQVANVPKLVKIEKDLQSPTPLNVDDIELANFISPQAFRILSNLFSSAVLLFSVLGILAVAIALIVLNVWLLSLFGRIF